MAHWSYGSSMSWLTKLCLSHSTCVPGNGTCSRPCAIVPSSQGPRGTWQTLPTRCSPHGNVHTKIWPDQELNLGLPTSTGVPLH
ncbi:hypothetical protein BJV78DRAFT_1183964 [Lactifluus subvellereus]|nr:hypothetical protein BJV78DRAFT_1183964 [Lactifluus subvellereus]